MDRNATTGFVAYNYRGFKILLDDIDNGTEACPSSGRAKTVLGVDAHGIRRPWRGIAVVRNPDSLLHLGRA